MSQNQNPKPANDHAVDPAVVETRHGRITFEDFSIDHMMASIREDVEGDESPQRKD